MTSVAIITARGGSKRIPRKNIKDFCGKPILAYSIEAALGSGLFDEVMISTDDEEIAAVGKKYGARIPFMRSAATSDDYATTADVLDEVLTEYRKRGQMFDWMCCIYPTAPFVTGDILREAWAYFQERQADALTPVVKFSYPPQRCFILEKGYLRYKWPEYIRSRSQDLEPFYHDAGQFYFYRVQGFQEGKVEKNVPYILNDMQVQDIDNVDDWEMAEIKYRRLHQGEV